MSLPFEGVRMISMHRACLTVLKSGRTYRYQFETEADLRQAFSGWCEYHAQLSVPDSSSDGLNIAMLRH